MYCPKCSQQQVSGEMRFCSRCGFPMNALRELVGGVGLSEIEAEAQLGQASKALKGVRKGAWMMLAALPLTLIAALVTAVNDVFAVFLLLPVLCFLAGFARLLYATFIEGRASRVKRDDLQPQSVSAMPAQVSAGGARAQGLLPAPGGAMPVEVFTTQRWKTAEMAQPPSVTENTTKLLDEETQKGGR